MLNEDQVTLKHVVQTDLQGFITSSHNLCAIVTMIMFLILVYVSVAVPSIVVIDDITPSGGNNAKDNEDKYLKGAIDDLASNNKLPIYTNTNDLLDGYRKKNDGEIKRNKSDMQGKGRNVGTGRTVSFILNDVFCNGKDCLDGVDQSENNNGSNSNVKKSISRSSQKYSDVTRSVLEEGIDEINRAIHKLDERIESEKVYIEMSEKDIEKVEDLLRKERNDLINKENFIKNLREKSSAEKEELNKANAKKRILNGELIALTKEADGKRQQVDMAEDDAKIIQKRIRKLGVEITSQTNELPIIKDRISELERDVADRDARLKKKKMEVDKLLEKKFSKVGRQRQMEYEVKKIRTLHDDVTNSDTS